MKFIHITDTHLVEAGALLYELDPLDRLERCIADINRHHGDAEFAIVTGDLAHSGRLPAYHALKGAFGKLRLKTWFMLGNHDKREHFLQVFPDSPRDADGFIQFTFDMPIGRCICLDTNHPDVPWGLLCEKRLAWLSAEHILWLLLHLFSLFLPSNYTLLLFVDFVLVHTYSIFHHRLVYPIFVLAYHR